MNAVVLVEVVNGAKIRMGEGGRDPGLAVETCNLVRVSFPEVHYLESDRAVELGVMGMIDGSHAASSNHLDDPIAPKRLGQAAQRRRICRLGVGGAGMAWQSIWCRRTPLGSRIC